MVVVYKVFDFIRFLMTYWFKQLGQTHDTNEQEKRQSEHTSNTLLELLGGAVTELRVAVGELVKVVDGLNKTIDPDSKEKQRLMDLKLDKIEGKVDLLDGKVDRLLEVLCPPTKPSSEQDTTELPVVDPAL